MQLTIPKLPADVADPSQLRDFLLAVQKLLEQKQIDDNKLNVDTVASINEGIPDSVKDALNASGSAPTYACRAWVNFNGTGVVAINASGNVSSITDIDIGRYRINFIESMVDINYSASGVTSGSSGDTLGDSAGVQIAGNGYTKLIGSVELTMYSPRAGNNVDKKYVDVQIYR